MGRIRIVHYPQGQYPSEHEYWLMDCEGNPPTEEWEWLRGQPGCWHTTDPRVALDTAQQHRVHILEA